MLAYVKGKIESKTLTYVVLDVGGLGYKIFMSLKAIEGLGEIGKEVKVHTYYKVAEDDISLFGFKTIEELRMFELLISVSGVGAKTALGMLAATTPTDFALAIIAEDVKELTKMPGIGAKSAARIILELKDKMKKEENVSNESIVMQEVVKNDDKVDEAISALCVLGYRKSEVLKVFGTFDKKELTTEDIIKKGLLLLSKQ